MRMTPRLSGALLAAATTALLATPDARSEDDLRVHYFKEPVPLTLDPSRVAVFDPDARPVAALGLGEARPWPIAGWRLAGLTDVDGEAGVRRAIAGATDGAGRPFVSPVFRDREGGAMFTTRHLLLQFHGLTDAEERGVLAAYDAGVILDADWAGMAGAYRIDTQRRDGFAVLRLANQLAQLDAVRFAEPDLVIGGKGAGAPTDPLFDLCWGLDNVGQQGGTPDIDIDAPEAWGITTGDPSVICVIIDVGVQLDHPDLGPLLGVDLTTDGGAGGPMNACDNHGTPVAGCLGALANGVGVVGAAPDVTLASARTFTSDPIFCDGSWSTCLSWTVDALTWAQTIGARITNNSNFYNQTSAAITAKYADTRDQGMIHFASVGNDLAPNISYPARLASVNAVTAVDRFGQPAEFLGGCQVLAGGSNFGNDVALAAPGESVWTTDRTGGDGWDAGDHTCTDGTSFASPFAAGVAALALTMNPALSPTELETLLYDTAVDLGFPGFDIKYGHGLVNAHETVKAAGGCGDIVSYGDGCAGFGGVVPELAFSGCPRPGGAVGFRLSDARPQSTAVMLFGTAPDALPGPGGCDLLVKPILPFLVVFPTGGTAGVPGSGELEVESTIPATASASALFPQVFVQDESNPWCYASTNGVELRIE